MFFCSMDNSHTLGSAAIIKPPQTINKMEIVRRPSRFRIYLVMFQRGFSVSSCFFKYYKLRKKPEQDQFRRKNILFFCMAFSLHLCYAVNSEKRKVQLEYE